MSNSNEDKITNYVTTSVAEEWSIDAEQTLFFVEVLAQLDINLTLRNSPDRFDALQDHFETTCETILKEGRYCYYHYVRGWVSNSAFSFDQTKKGRETLPTHLFQIGDFEKAKAWDVMYNQHSEDNFPNGEYPASAWHQIELMDGYLKRANLAHDIIPIIVPSRLYKNSKETS